MRTPILDGKTRDASAADGDTEMVTSKKHIHPSKTSSPEMVLEKSICTHARQVMNRSEIGIIKRIIKLFVINCIFYSVIGFIFD